MENRKKEKNRTIFSVLLLLSMIFFTCITTYAYFTAIFESSTISKVDVSSGVLPITIVENAKTLSVEVTLLDMLETNASATVPAVIDSDIISVTSTLSKFGGSASIFYDVYYEPIDIYERSSLNLADSTGKFSNELTLKLTNLNTGKTEIIDLSNIDNKINILSDVFSFSGENAVASEEIEIEIAYYNQLFDQSVNAGEIFSGNVFLEITSVEYTSAEID